MRTSKAHERIIGIDPGVERMGVGIIDVTRGVPQCVHVACVTTSKKLDQSVRIEQLAEKLSAIIKKYKPDRAAVEKLFFSRNVKTAMSVAEARGVILLTLRQWKLPVTEWTPQQIKQHVTGYGNADKKQIQATVKLILRLPRTVRSDDAADALAVALTAQQLPPR